MWRIYFISDNYVLKIDVEVVSNVALGPPGINKAYGESLYSILLTQARQLFTRKIKVFTCTTKKNQKKEKRKKEKNVHPLIFLL